MAGIRMIVFNNEEHGRAIAKAAGCNFNPECDRSISRVSDEDGELLGGVIYQSFTGESIAMHVAGFDDRWINRDLVWVCFHYPFVQLGVKRIFGQVPESNKQALEFDLRLGFRFLVKVDGVFRDGGVIVLVLERDDCQWLNYKPRRLKPGQEI
jgi:hypothetical protein